jgi:hypothetical protein
VLTEGSPHYSQILVSDLMSRILRRLARPGSAAPAAHSPRDLGGDLRKRRTARAYGVYLGAGIRAGQRPVARSSDGVAGKLKVAPYTMTSGIFDEPGGMPSDHAAYKDAGQRAGLQLLLGCIWATWLGAEQASDLHRCRSLDTRALVAWTIRFPSSRPGFVDYEACELRNAGPAVPMIGRGAKGFHHRHP